MLFPRAIYFGPSGHSSAGRPVVPRNRGITVREAHETFAFRRRQSAEYSTAVFAAVSEGKIAKRAYNRNNYVGDKKVSGLNEKERTLYRRRDIGFVFQFYNLIPTLTAYENVDMVSKLSKDSISAESALEAVGLEDRADNLPSQMSGGELQRVSIARAICKNPKLLLCDEPTAALDSETGKKVLIMLQSMVQKYNSAVVLVTHNTALTPTADRLVRLKDGKISEIVNNEKPVSMEEVAW